MGLRDNLKNIIDDQQRAADEAAERAKREAAIARAKSLDTAIKSFCRLLDEGTVQEIIEHHIKSIRGMRVVVLGCSRDRAVIYLDPESNVPRQFPLDIEFNADPFVMNEAIESVEVQAAIEALKKEGVIVTAGREQGNGAIRVTLDYRNI
ncbi:hypothetical protein [Agrobacterium pusense]|uniref:Uncharacterized protein n=1 Tax=Agrobacterium pusense TaxID=648995 RepID=U4PUP6_9HYPH|nr:hypothetical protein [Agrobacterium pusense]CDI08783.1 protein of unknown function [Agrobacterium pusense]